MDKQKCKKCAKCGSINTIKRGVRRTENRGNIQRFYCKDCNKRFVVRDAFYHMRNNPQKITLCLDLYFRGISLRKIQEHLQAFYPHNSSHQTVLNWIRRYCMAISNFTDKLKINTSTQLTFDEMEYKTKGRQSFFFDIMDMETRYLIASTYAYDRTYKTLFNTLKLARDKADMMPKEVYTDGLGAYPRLINAVYRKRNIKHFVTISSDKRFNWKIERLHENIRERTKTMRQFKSLESAKAIMKGWEIFYNFIRKHQALGCCPYEIATDLKLGTNKWLDLINMSEGL